MSDPRKLGRSARRALARIDRGAARCAVPAVCLIEIALLNERGRLQLSTAQAIALLSPRPSFMLFPVDIEQCLEFAALVGIRDPMDRLVASAARVLNVPLISADVVLDGMVDRIWD